MPLYKCEAHGSSHDKKKKWKHQIGESTSMPFCMKKWRIYMSPAPRIIHQYHKGNGHTTKYINRIYSSRFCHVFLRLIQFRQTAIPNKIKANSCCTK